MDVTRRKLKRAVLWCWRWHWARTGQSCSTYEIQKAIMRRWGVRRVSDLP